MLKQGIASCIDGQNNSTTNNWGRLCDTCQSTAATVYCRADSAYLCTTCDVDIHAANPLACRHHRVPFLPIYGEQNQKQDNDNEDEDEDEDETASWLLFNPPHNNNYYHCNQISNNNGVMFGDEYLDLVDYNSCQHNDSDEYTSVVTEKSYGGDSVVPVQQQKFQLEYHVSNTSGYGYPASIAQTASLSSMDVGLVPESTMSDVSISHPRPHKGTIDLFCSPSIQVPTQLTPMDRVARVLRYREKKKTRKFEKTIRYASRKAYAETRPRVKGRFAKRTNTQVEVDQMFSPTLGQIEYGIVPSY